MKSQNQVPFQKERKLKDILKGKSPLSPYSHRARRNASYKARELMGGKEDQPSFRAADKISKKISIRGRMPQKDNKSS